MADKKHTEKELIAMRWNKACAFVKEMAAINKINLKKIKITCPELEKEGKKE